MSLRLLGRVSWLLILATLLVLVIDTGSIVLSRVRVKDDVLTAGLAGSGAVEGLPATPGTASVALRAAEAEAHQRRLRLQRSKFLLYAGGTVELSGSRTAPTLLLHRLEPLRHFADVRASATARPRPYQ